MRSTKLLFALTLLGSTQLAIAQGPPSGPPLDTLEIRKKNIFERVRNEHINYFSDRNDSNARAEKIFGRWETFWNPRIYYNAPSEEEMFTTYNQALKLFFEPRNPYQQPDHTNGNPRQPNLSNTIAQRCVASYPSNWKYDGPNYDNWGSNATDNAGQVTCIWVDPTNSNHLIIGTFSSGVWETNDEGRNWVNVTDNSTGYTWGPLGVNNLAIHPVNRNIQYFSTEYRKTTAGLGGFYGYSRGIFFRNSSNGAFIHDLAFRERMRSDGFFDGGDRYDLIPRFVDFSGSGNLYATYDRNIYQRSDFTTMNGDASLWKKIPMNYAIPQNYQILAGAFSKVSPGKMVFMTNTIQNKLYLITYDENNSSQSAQVHEINNPNVSPVSAHWWNRMNDVGVRKMEFSYKSDQLCLTYCGLNGQEKHFYKINTPFNSPSIDFVTNMNRDLFVFKLHPVYDHLIYFGNTQGKKPMFVSYNGGNNIITLTPGNDARSWLRDNETLHADVRDIVLLHAGTDSLGKSDLLYIATDGGITKKESNGIGLKSLTGKGLNIGQCYDVSVSQTNSHFTVNGMQDTEHSFKVKPANGPAYWKHFSSGADGVLTAISKNGKDYFAANDQSGISHYGYTNNDNLEFKKVYEPRFDQRSGAWEKPTKFDKDNNLLYANRYVWQNPNRYLEVDTIKGDYWERYWDNEPVDITNGGDPNKPTAPYNDQNALGIYKKPMEFYKSEFKPDEIGYLANYNWGNDNNREFDKDALLYFTNNNGFSWRNISPPTALVNNYVLRHIEIDQLNPYRVWMALGFQGDQAIWNQTPAQRTKRVLYCEDASEIPAIWQDVSKGLPPLPINRLLYIPGSEDVIFAGTDGGVYRWSKVAQQWECFMDGMPQSIITDLEFNTCSGMLKAATYGRGVWETELEPGQNSFNHTAPYYEEITGSPRWGENRSVIGGIRVKSGATLTISGCTVYMPRNSKIHLEKGATLIIEKGALLTNDCDDVMWGGIEMYGNQGVSQVPASGQSKVIIRGNSTIRHAKIGVSDFSKEYWNSGGGIIEIDSANFENCYRAVAFNDYPRFNNISKIVNTKIWVDDAYKLSSANSRDFITVFNENNILIERCTFEDKRTFTSGTDYSDKLFNGIFVYRGGVNAKRNTFRQLTSGVKNETDIITASFSTVIDLNQFNDVKDAIYQGGNYTDVKNNTITGMAGRFFGNLSGQLSGKVTGIYFNGTTLGYVHNNGVVFGSTAMTKYGFISNGSKFQNLVKLTDNKFQNSYAGIQTQRFNRDIQMICNNLVSNRYALSVNPESPNGDFAHQGQGFGNNDWRPRNTFTTNNTDVYFNVASSSPLVPAKYYVKSVSSSSPKIPSTIAGPMAGNFNTVINNSGNDAACFYETGGVSSPQKRPLGINDINGAVGELKVLAQSGDRFSSRAVELYSYLIDTLYKSVDPLSYSNNLVLFLKQDKTDISRFLLIGHYTIHKDSLMVNKYIDSLEDITGDEKLAYRGFLNLQNRLIQQYGTVLDLPFDSLKTAPVFVDEYLYRDDFVGELVRTWVNSFGLGIHEDLYIEEIIEAGEGAVPNSITTKSKLLSVSPVPASTQLDIQLAIAESIETDNYYIQITNSVGKLVFRQEVRDNNSRLSLTVESWVAGMYHVSLYRNGKVMATEKVSVVH